ncbi:MAG TPA: hypothetical protein VKT31_12120 [Solirubrobacteraceae bacterium]|nr:hypothetical protein [Solirubrobacteraceae bacterium]
MGAINGRARRIACTLGITAVAGAGAGTGIANAHATAVPVNTSPPSISAAVPVVGQAITATHGGWTGGGTSYEDWWIRCKPTCTTIIPGATGLSYTPTAADAGAVLEFGEMASNGTGQSKPAFSSVTQVVLATPPIHFTLIGPTGIPQFAYYLVKPTGHKPTARDWAYDQNTSATVGEVDADVSPGQTIWFSPTGVVNQSWNGIRHTLTPEGISGKPFNVTASTPMQVRVVLPMSAPAYHPGLSKAELYVLGRLNRKRKRLHEPPLKISTILDEVASVAARDEAVHHRWPDPYFFSLAGSFGWPGDLTRTGFAIADAPLTKPSQVLAHWDGAYSGESAGIWHTVTGAPFYRYAGIADGGGAWQIVVIPGCPVTVNAAHVCGLTNITGL